MMISIMAIDRIKQDDIRHFKAYLADAQAGRFAPESDVISPDNRRYDISANPTRQLTPFEHQVANILGWISAHKETGTANGTPDHPTAFELQFEADLLEFTRSRDDAFHSMVEFVRASFVGYERGFESEGDLRKGPLARYSQNL